MYCNLLYTDSIILFTMMWFGNGKYDYACSSHQRSSCYLRFFKGTISFCGHHENHRQFLATPLETPLWHLSLATFASSWPTVLMVCCANRVITASEQLCDEPCLAFRRDSVAEKLLLGITKQRVQQCIVIGTLGCSYQCRPCDCLSRQLQ